MSAGSATWLYALALGVDAGALEGVTGVAGEPVRTVAGGGLLAVVGSVPLHDFGEQPLRDHLEDLAWLEPAARAHHAVIEAAARAGHTLPLRFATLYRDDDRVRAMLEERRQDLTAALERVAGRTEWGVKAYADPETFVEDAAPAGQPGGGDRPGTAYLLQRRARRGALESAQLRAQECAAELRTALSRLAVATAPHAPQDAGLAGYQGWMVLNDSYLVADAQTGAFAAEVDALRARFPGVRLESSGPWPAYSFTALPGGEQLPGGEEPG